MALWKARCPDCTIPSKDDDCPLASLPLMPCGFGAGEIERRRKLPLVWDNATRTRRKYTGIRERVEEDAEVSH